VYVNEDAAAIVWRRTAG